MPNALTTEEERTLLETRLRDLGLTIAGSRLQRGIETFRDELEQIGLVRLKPFFYLSTEWGVPSASIARLPAQRSPCNSDGAGW